MIFWAHGGAQTIGDLLILGGIMAIFAGFLYAGWRKSQKSEMEPPERPGE